MEAAANGLDSVSADTLPQLALSTRMQQQAATAIGPAPDVTPGYVLDWLNDDDADNWYYRAVTDERVNNVNGT